MILVDNLTSKFKFKSSSRQELTKPNSATTTPKRAVYLHRTFGLYCPDTGLVFLAGGAVLFLYYKDTTMIIPWIGSKRLLRKHIIPLIPSNIDCYCEPFGGAGWILFSKEKWAKQEVYNDLNGGLVNLFLQVKFHPEELKNELQSFNVTPNIFNKLKNFKPLTEIQKAAKFYILISFSFGAKGDQFAFRAKEPQKSLTNRFPAIDKLHKRLDKVMIDNRDYRKVLDYYDRPGAFFYIDPPYIKGTKYANAKRFNHTELKQQLEKLQGRWLLSLDDCPESRKLFKSYEMLEITRLKGINGNANNMTYKEILVANYPISSLKVA